MNEIKCSHAVLVFLKLGFTAVLFRICMNKKRWWKINWRTDSVRWRLFLPVFEARWWEYLLSDLIRWKRRDSFAVFGLSWNHKTPTTDRHLPRDESYFWRAFSIFCLWTFSLWSLFPVGTTTFSSELQPLTTYIYTAPPETRSRVHFKLLSGNSNSEGIYTETTGSTCLLCPVVLLFVLRRPWRRNASKRHGCCPETGSERRAYLKSVRKTCLNLCNKLWINCDLWRRIVSYDIVSMQ